MAALAEEVEVEVAHGREEAVGVVARPGAAVGVARLDLVVLQAEHVRALPDAVGHVGERDAGAGGEDHGHGLRQGAERADDDEVVVDAVDRDGVLAEDRVRSGVDALGDGAQIVVGDLGEADGAGGGCGRGGGRLVRRAVLGGHDHVGALLDVGVGGRRHDHVGAGQLALGVLRVVLGGGVCHVRHPFDAVGVTRNTCTGCVNASSRTKLEVDHV